MTRVEQDHEAASVVVLARRFTMLVRGRGAGEKVAPDAALAKLEAWDVWLADAHTSGVRAMETFAAGLEQDDAGVRSVLTHPGATARSPASSF